MALPPTLPRDVPSLLEITYHSDPEGSAAPNQRRIPFRLGAPRLGTLPVAQTVWQAGILEGFQLRLDGGNLYPLEPNEFQNERRQSLAGLPPGLPPTLERGDHSAGETPQANRPLSASALFFKKLKGDAQLRLVAVPRPDPAVLNSWLWFGAALATLAGLERIFGRARRSA